MAVLEWIKVLWPLVAVMAAFGVRMEVGQALNRQRLRTIEKDIAREQNDRRAEIAGVHTRVERHETETGKVLAEIRNDIKTILSRMSR